MLFRLPALFYYSWFKFLHGFQIGLRTGYIYSFFRPLLFPERCALFSSIYCILWSVKNVSDLNMHLKVKKTFPINSFFFSYLRQVERLLQVCWMCYIAFTMRKKRNRTMHFYSKVSQMEATKHAKQETDFKVLLWWLVHILADLCLYSHHIYFVFLRMVVKCCALRNRHLMTSWFFLSLFWRSLIKLYTSVFKCGFLHLQETIHHLLASWQTIVLNDYFSI